MLLSDHHPIFVGFKMDGSLRRRLEALTGPERKYIADDGDFLRILRFGEDGYVGKVVSERITTERIDDIRRNVLSILQRLSPDTRFPTHLDILVCVREGETGAAAWAPAP